MSAKREGFYEPAEEIKWARFTFKGKLSHWMALKKDGVFFVGRMKEHMTDDDSTFLQHATNIMSRPFETVEEAQKAAYILNHPAVKKKSIHRLFWTPWRIVISLTLFSVGWYFAPKLTLLIFGIFALAYLMVSVADWGSK